MKLDDFVQASWLLCNDWYFSFRYDQIWMLVATCEHQRFEVHGKVFQVEDDLLRLYNNIGDWHDTNEKI